MKGCRLGIILLFLLFAGGVQAQTDAAKSTADVPVSYGILVDNSGSYRLLLDRVVAMVKTIVEANQPEDEAFLIRFVSSDKVELLQDMTGDNESLYDAADEMYVEGGFTSILDAVKFGAVHLTDNAKKADGRTQALILVTDGDERQSLAKIDDVLKILKDGKIKVFVVAVSDEKVSTKLIDRLAKDTGGIKYTPKTRADIPAAVKELVIDIRRK